MEKKITIWIILVLSMLGCSATAQNNLRPNTQYEMIQDFLKDRSALSADIALSIYKRNPKNSPQKYYLRTEIENKLEKTICIPSIFYDQHRLIHDDQILTVLSDDGTPVDKSFHPAAIKWPTESYVILLPKNKRVMTIELSERYILDNYSGGLHVQYSFPAFFCEIFERGYPVTERILNSPASLTNLSPRIIVEGSEIVVFSGNTNLEGPQPSNDN